MPSKNRQYPNKSELVLPPPGARWLDICQAAAYMGYGTQTVRAIIHRGELRAAKIDRFYRIDRNDIDEYMIRRKRVVAPYRRGTHPWTSEMHARNRKAAK